MSQPPKYAFFADYTGILAAFICLVHCILAPLWLGAAAELHHHHHAADMPWFLHHGWDFVFLLVGFLAVKFSSRHTHQNWMRMLLWVSYGLLAAAILLESYGEIFRNLVYISSIGLIGAHLLSLKASLRKTKRPSASLERE